MIKAAIVGLVLVLLVGVEPAESSRAPTYIERVTIMDAFNKPGRSVASRCVRIVVSTADPRYAILSSPRKYPQACVAAGEVGDGYALFRRQTRRSLRWRDIGEASDPPCDFKLPAAVLRDLFPRVSC
jgi:hypothetical protein